MRDDYTIGVEEEYQLVDAETGALRSRASDVLSTDWSDELQGELHETTVEMATAVCEGAEDVEAELSRRRFQTATTAAAEGLEIAAAGLHPFSPWQAQTLGDTDRYRRILRHHERVSREANIYGMHVHVGIPERMDRARLMERLRPYIPHLLALSCSSPFQDAEDTGFASYRAVLWRQYPYAGIPPRFENDEQYREFVALLLESEAVHDKGNIYWSIRPHFSYPTIEFRAMDTCPRMEDAATIASLTRLLVMAVAEGGLESPDPGSLTSEQWRIVITENEWHVARYGLDAFLADPAADGKRVPVRTAIRQLLDRLAPVAESLDETDTLARVERLIERGNGADRMRKVYQEYESFEEVVWWLVRETTLNTGFDRRRTQRVSEA